MAPITFGAPVTFGAQASREILWNVNTLPNVVGMYTLFGISLVICLVGLLRHVELWQSGKPAPSYNPSILDRVEQLLSLALLQTKVSKERIPGVAHAFIYVGFLVLLFTTTMVFIDNDLGIRIYQGEFYLAVTLMSDLLGIGVLLGCMLAAHRRYIKKPDLIHNRWADSAMLIVLSLLIIQGFLLEGLRIRATDDPWALYSPIGLLFSYFFWPLPPRALTNFHFLMWWFHTITVFLVFALVPYSKYFHVFGSSLNLFFRDPKRPLGALEYQGDLMQLMEAGDEFSIGLGTIKDYSWKHLMDLDACTSCGRCQAVCPAYRSGKPLSPKWLILDTRNHALQLNAQEKIVSSKVAAPFKALDKTLSETLLFPSLGLKSGGDGQGLKYDENFRASNKNVENSYLSIGASVDARISGEVLDPNVFWSCTTCMACVEACPVGINHVDQIVGNRRNMALMHGEIPQEAQGTLRALENRANPYGAPQDRIKWLEGLDVPLLKPGDKVDYLYWVGCVSAYDPRKQKIARSLATIMKSANLSFGILGIEEGCSGDPARRLGEENLFQTLAKKNIELLKSLSFKTLVANCPHCFNTIKNEYPQFGNLQDGSSPEIIHHSVLLKRLMAEDKLKLKDEAAQVFKKTTFHDPCYLGRYNQEYDAPRQVVEKASSLKIIEMEDNKEKGLCCGAGGGHFWMDLKIGERVNVLRVNQASDAGAQRIATACPFCMQMMEDGVKLTNRESELEVKDIAEIVASQLA